MAYPTSPNLFNSTVTVTGFSTLASPDNPPSYSQEVPEDEIPPQTSVAAVQLPPHIFDCAIKADLVAEEVQRAEARESLARASTLTGQVAQEFDIGDETTLYWMTFEPKESLARISMPSTRLTPPMTESIPSIPTQLMLTAPPSAWRQHFYTTHWHDFFGSACPTPTTYKYSSPVTTPLASSSMLDQANLVATVVEAVRLANKRLALPSGSATLAKDVDVGATSMRNYLSFVGVTNIKATLTVSEVHEVDDYTLFKSDNMSLEQLEKLGLLVKQRQDKTIPVLFCVSSLWGET
ncbi:hypothetical protein KEM48_003706 [Puccinia striiformis f. sp. tritici PST-130]|nr:hypothetical protein KEM48_003706 [Puccinia striiformis f. sp. tritici PST-130]